MKISGIEFSKAGDKYLGRSYEEMDCQAFVEKCMADVGYPRDLGGSNSWYRECMKNGWVGNYFLDPAKDGAMATGWAQEVYEDWYYLNEDGTMKTGWLDRNGVLFYLYPVSDGWMGRMLTGWQQINGKWYYFETAAGKNQGHMYRSGRTPDGYYVGADGVWDGKPAEEGR